MRGLEEATEAFRAGRIPEARAILDACGPLEPEAQLLQIHLRFHEARSDQALALGQDLLRQWTAPAEASLRVRLLLLLACRLPNKVDGATARAWLDEAAELVSTDAQRARLAFAASDVARREGALERAEEEAEEAVRLARRSGEASVLGEALFFRGKIRFYRYAYPPALADLEQARALLEEAGEHREALACDVLRTTVRFYVDPPEVALETASRLSDELVALGAAWLAVRTLNIRGSALIDAGRPEEAVACFDRILAIGKEADEVRDLGEANRAIALLQAGRPDAAVEQVEVLLARLAEEGKHAAADAFATILLPGLAAQQDLERWDEVFETTERVAANLGFIERSVAALCEDAARVLERSEVPTHLDRAARARALALRGWQMDRQEAEIARCRDALVSLARRGARAPLDRLLLDRPIGRGAMGEVWIAEDARDGSRVAVKVLTAEAARRPDRIRSVEHELRTVASLDHPAIVRLLDHTRTTAAVAAMTEGRVPEGSPALVLELVEGGTLEGLCGQLAWDEVRDVLRALLDALAHAHARQVLHLDLKPANVLRAGDGTVKLTDFGVARAMVDPRERLPLAGTPAFMAPEQLLQLEADLGPWTDLYALGGLAWTLVTGEPPYGTDDQATLRERHLRGQLPPLEATVPVPSDLEPWLRRLLASPPRHRYRRAADAAWDLVRLGDSGGIVSPATGSPLRAGTTGAPALPTLVLPDDDDLFEERPAEEALAAPSASPPPLPRSGRTSRGARAPFRGAGPRLLSLRSWPLVGRESVQDALWSALCSAHDQRRPVRLRLDGPHGVGRSRLLDWLAERAHEVGAATVLRADALDRAPVPALLRRLFGAEAREERIAGWMTDMGADPEEAAAVAEAAAGGAAIGALPVLSALARHRIVLVVLDGVELPPELSDALDGPVLTVGTASSGSPLPVPPLSSAQVRSILATRLPLEDAAVAELAEAAQGLPMLADLLLSLAVEGEGLQWSREGLRRRSGVGLDLPASLDAAWTARIRRLARGEDPAPFREAAAGPAPWSGSAGLLERALDARVLAAREQRVGVPSASARATLRG